MTGQWGESAPPHKSKGKAKLCKLKKEEVAYEQKGFL